MKLPNLHKIRQKPGNVHTNFQTKLVKFSEQFQLDKKDAITLYNLGKNIIIEVISMA